MSAAEKLAEPSPIDGALARFASGDATRADVVTLVEHAKAIGLRQVQVTVYRFAKVRRDATIRLMGKSGPYSSEDRKVTRASERYEDRLWAAWWEVDELEYWLEHHREKQT